MSETTNTNDEANADSGLATLIIPAQLAPQVVDFVETLEISADDVSGYFWKMQLNSDAPIHHELVNRLQLSSTRCTVTKDGLDIYFLDQ